MTNSTTTQLTTERLILRRWQESDFEPFCQLNADPVVMEYFLNVLTPDQTREMIDRMESRFDQEGIGYWAVELADTKQFIGCVGLGRPNWQAHFTPCVEIGWRLARPFWGKGYAPEAARATLRDGFERMNFDEIVSITATINSNSIKVMEKIGMKTKPDENFNHPVIEDGHRLQLHVLYRLTKDEWKLQGSNAGAKR